MDIKKTLFFINRSHALVTKRMCMIVIDVNNIFAVDLRSARLSFLIWSRHLVVNNKIFGILSVSPGPGRMEILVKVVVRTDGWLYASRRSNVIRVVDNGLKNIEFIKHLKRGEGKIIVLKYVRGCVSNENTWKWVSRNQ